MLLFFDLKCTIFGTRQQTFKDFDNKKRSTTENEEKIYSQGVHFENSELTDVNTSQHKNVSRTVLIQNNKHKIYFLKKTAFVLP